MKATAGPADAGVGMPRSGLSAEADVALYYSFLDEAMHRGTSGNAAHVLADDFVEHGSAGDQRARAVMARFAARRTRFPDAVWTVELLTGVSGMVVCHTTMTRPGARDRADTGWETVVVRVSAGRIAECWRLCDERLRLDEEGAAERE